MSSINLAVEKEESSYPKFLKSGLIGAVAALLLVLCLYLGLLYMNKRVMAEIKDVDSQYASEYAKFLAGNANEVIDFKNRMSVSENLISKKYSIKNVFDAIEASVLPTVYLESLSYSGNNTVEVTCVAPGFFDEAKQIESFKENSAFASFALGKSAIDPKTGLVNFSASLKMK